MCESPSGAVRIVAAPRTTMLQPAGAMNVLPATVVFGVSAAICSRCSAVVVAGGGGGGALGGGGGGGAADCEEQAHRRRIRERRFRTARDASAAAASPSSTEAVPNRRMRARARAPQRS